MKLASIALSLAVALTAACGSKSEDGGAGTAKSADGEAGGMAAVKLEALGLSIDAPAGATAEDLAGSLLVSKPPFALTVDIAGEFTAKTVEEAEEEAKGNNGSEITKEKLADGFALTYKNTGSMGDNYWVQVIRTMGDKTYSCSTTTTTAELQAQVLAACKSLK